MITEDSPIGEYKITDPYAMYFLTWTTVGWVDIFTRKECAQLIVDSLRYCQENKGLILFAWVLMSNHLHLLASAKKESSGLSGITRDFKRHTAKQILQWIKDDKESRRSWMNVVFKYYGKYNSNNEVFQVWQQYSHPKICYSPSFTMQKLDYIHWNPVKAGIVDNPGDYRYSSARNYLLRNDALLDVKLLDYGPTIGYIPS